MNSELHQEFSRYLDEERDALSSLLNLLESESAALNQGSVADLPQIVNSKQPLIERLEHASATREALLESAGFDPVDAEMAFSQLSSVLEDNFHRNLEIANACQKHNVANGIHINRTEQFCARSLQVMTGSVEAPLYSSTGSATSQFDEHFLGNA